MGRGERVRGERPREAANDLHEVACNGDLGADVAELGPDAEEESVLLVERAWIVFRDGVFLVVHVRILEDVRLKPNCCLPSMRYLP